MTDNAPVNFAPEGRPIPIVWGPGAEATSRLQQMSQLDQLQAARGVLMTGGAYFQPGQPDEVRLYLEAHVTIEPVFDERREQAAEIAKRYGFKLADLLMKKRAEDTEERSSKDTFMTGHSKSRADIATRVQHLVRTLQASGFKVWRYKIEDTLLDSRNNDEWNLIDQ